MERIPSEKPPRKPTKNPYPYCPDCDSIKENPQQAYCNPCRSRRSKEWGLETGRIKREQTRLCPCGAERGVNQPYYCNSCKAAKSREWRLLHRTPQDVLDRKKQELDALALFKRKVRKITQECIRIGVLIKQSCEICNKVETVEAHHEDYNKPLEIRWLCREHHLARHRDLKNLNIEENINGHYS